MAEKSERRSLQSPVGIATFVHLFEPFAFKATKTRPADAMELAALRAEYLTALIDDALAWLLGNDLPYLIAPGWHIDDTLRGNGNGVADPGEQIALPVTLANHGSGAASGVWARAELSRADLASFMDNFAFWPLIGSGQSLESEPPHLMLRVAEDAPCGSVVDVTLALRTDEGFRATRRLSFKIGKGGGLHTTYPWPSEPQAIPNPGILDAPIAIGEGFVVGDVNCRVDISHSSISLIKVILESPAGTRVTLHDRTGDGNRLAVTYDTERQPAGPGSMSDFDGEIGTGVWHLYVNDMKPDMMAGALNAWSLVVDTDDLCHDAPCSDTLPASVGASVRVSKLAGSDVRVTWNSVAGADHYVIWRARDPRLTDAENRRANGRRRDRVGRARPAEGRGDVLLHRARGERVR
ncbi:MAG: hypothetical protein HC882_06420 [Acidobacteria bacterium]|nr:hypothetical protein [Acidobacteriota bacterium]